MPLEYHKLELALSQYVVIIAPLMRSLWSLEASTANASDVFVFFTAIAAQLRDLFQKSPRETGIPTELANSVIEIFNDEYDNMFLNNDIYFVAFALDPRRFRSSLVSWELGDLMAHMHFARVSHFRLPAHTAHRQSKHHCPPPRH